MTSERFPERFALDLSECDTLAIRKLVAAVFTEAMTEADLTSQWAVLVAKNHGERTLPFYTTAVHLLESHVGLSHFLRCRTGTELLEWMAGNIGGNLEPEAYWALLEEKLERSRYGLRHARKIIARGPPPQ